jgi:hypothetical protein
MDLRTMPAKPQTPGRGQARAEQPGASYASRNDDSGSGGML